MFKKLLRRASPHKRKVIVGYLIVLAAYIILVLLYVIFFIAYKDQTHAFFDKAFGEDGYGADLSASLLEDLAIFLILGFSASIISTLVSLNNPEESSFETRLKTLTNSDKINIDDQLYGFLKKNITNFLAFNKKMTVVLEIRDFSPIEKAFYIYADMDTLITNMCKDSDFASEAEAEAFITSDACINGDNGTVVYLGTYDPSTNKTIKEFANGEKLIDKFEKKVDIEIPRNEELGLRFKFIIWNRTGNPDVLNNWYHIATRRYTRHVEITLRNSLKDKQTLKYDLVHRNNAQKDVNLPKITGEIGPESQKVVLTKKELYPNERLEFYFYEP